MKRQKVPFRNFGSTAQKAVEGQVEAPSRQFHLNLEAL
jgi:hypothetical protein